MDKLNYSKFENATILSEFTNRQGKKVLLVEHPFYGDEHPIVILFPTERLAFNSGKNEVDDMFKTSDYEPYLISYCNCIFALEL
jgi:hypothetical protein